jgi:hypothetical protein
VTTVTLDESQVRILVQAWERPDLVYDLDWLVRRLNDILGRTGAVKLGTSVPDALRDAINEGYLYVDQVKAFNAFSGFRAFVGLTQTGQSIWSSVFPNAGSGR